MSFKDFKKDLQKKKEQEETMKELNSAVNTLTKKRDGYVKAAKDAMKSGNMSLYNANVALLKNAIFNLKQAQDMVANFTIARDLMEMQNLNKRFVKSLDSVMKDVYKTCKAIHVSTSEKMFTKALYQQTQTSLQLKNALETNNMTFANSVSTISDIGDDEINQYLKDEIAGDEQAIDDELDQILGQLNVPASASVEDKEEHAPELVSPVPQNPVKPAETPVQRPVENSSNNASVKPEDAEQTQSSPENVYVGGDDSGFVWDNIPSIGFDDIAGLEDVKNTVKIKVLLPLRNPEAFAGYEKKNGGGLCLYGPPGTGKTMIAAAIAKEIGAKFCSVKPSDLLRQGAGNTERAVRTLFQQARKFPCSVIYFDEMDSISPKSTKSQYAKQLRSEFLAQLQGVESYGKDNGNILFLICATNKPWDIDSAFLRPGRFGTKVYVGLPDAPAREYMLNKRISKIKAKGIVSVDDDLDIAGIVEATNGFNGADITNFLDKVEELSIVRGIETGTKNITKEDFANALQDVHSSVQAEDIVKLKEWREENDQ